MKIIPVVKEILYLRDYNKQFAQIEGDVPESERAWVSVRQATEGDHSDIAELRKRRVTRWVGNVPEEITNVNPRTVWAMEAYRCLTGMGNLELEDSTPVFEFENSDRSYQKVKGDFATFKKRWGDLPDFVVDAVMAAVWDVNPGFTWWSSVADSGDESGEAPAETDGVSEIT